MKEDSRPVMVSIRCLVYNHEPFLRQCLEGFVMQQTNFRFEAIVHDDASTDQSTAIVREYAEKYPEIIKPVLETENQYSKGRGLLDHIMDEHIRGKYVVHRPSVVKELYSVEDALNGGGGFMATCSLFYRWEYLLGEGRPDFWRKSPVGDLPLMLFFASKGYLGYIDEVMSVYRKQAVGSWSARQDTLKKRTRHHKIILQLYDSFDEYTGYRYHTSIKAKKDRNIKGHRKDAFKSIFRYIRDKVKGILPH